MSLRLRSVPSLVIIDHPESGSDGADLAAYAAAMTRSMIGDFAPEYQKYASIRVGSLADKAPGEYVFGLFEHPDQLGALGYHDVGPDGRPFAKAFPKLDKNDGAKLSVTMDHETKEFAEDLWCDLARSGIDGRLWADEPCDAVEQDEYVVDGVSLSNFVLPGWYSGRGKPDFLGTLRKPLSVSPGGYAQFLSPKGGWKQITHSHVGPRRYRRNHSGRSHKRGDDFLRHIEVE